MTHTRTFASDALTPVRAYASLRQADPDGASFLFESVVGGERWGRYSILGYRPRYEAILDRTGWKLRGENPPPFDPKPGDPIVQIGDLFKPSTSTQSQAERFATAPIGYLAWDIVHVIEKVPPGNDDTWTKHFVPLARFLGGATVVVFDALAQTVTIAAETEEEVDRAFEDLKREPKLGELRLPDRSKIPTDITIDQDDAAYEKNVLRAKEYIAAGDAFQIVLARTFSVPRAGRDAFEHVRRSLGELGGPQDRGRNRSGVRRRFPGDHQLVLQRQDRRAYLCQHEGDL